MENENKKLGQEPAFASATTDSSSGAYHIEVGMSKRFYAACAAMQGILANKTMIKGIIKNNSLNNSDRSLIIVQFAYEIADKLLKEENL